MTDYLSLIDPVELTSYGRLAAADFDAQVSSLTRFMPNQQVNDIRYSYNKGAAAFVDEAVFRAFDAESSIGKRPPASRLTGEILPISRKIPLSEYAQLRLRNAGSNELVDAHFSDAANLSRGIAARLERARGGLLETGKVTIAENGVATEYDSGRVSGNTIALLGSTARWSAYTTATPIANVLAWAELIRSATGVTPNRMIVSATVMAHLQQCDEVRGAFQPAATAPLRVSRDVVNDAFVSLAGVAVEVYVPPAGMATPPLDPKKVILLVDSVPVGQTLYGVPVEASEPEYSSLSVVPGLVAGVYKEKDPVIPWTKAVALALPTLQIPDATLAAAVIA